MSKWWGWGEERLPLPPGALALLEGELGVEPGAPAEPPALEAVELPAPGGLPEAIAEAVGGENVLSGMEDRLHRAAGRSYPDLVRLRSGRPGRAPDAVVLPGSAPEVLAVLRACAEGGVAVVPFGGGTSVVGGVDPVAGELDRVVALDLSRMRSVEVDRTSLTARLGPGLRGPDAEAALGRSGVTLGHYPQSYECATIGGFAATRSAGQASSGYGRFDELVISVELTAPAGILRTLQTPHTAAGPSLRELVVGSEGVLGVLTEVRVRVRPQPGLRLYEGWMAADFASGTEAVRTLAQSEALPDVIRLSDREETRLSLAMASSEGISRRLLDSYLRLRRRDRGCIVIAGWEGQPERVRRRRAVAGRLLRAAGAVPLGQAAGRSWERSRFAGPYLRDELIGLGVMVETLETAHSWSRLDELYAAVGEAIRGALAAGGAPGLVMCHLSHAYPDGASLYFTLLAKARRGVEIEQWRAVKAAASSAIVAAEGTITHHHAIGRDHAPYMPAEVGELGLEALRGVKERLDPAGIMNPGKLFPSA